MAHVCAHLLVVDNRAGGSELPDDHKRVGNTLQNE